MNHIDESGRKKLVEFFEKVEEIKKRGRHLIEKMSTPKDYITFMNRILSTYSFTILTVPCAVPADIFKR